MTDKRFTINDCRVLSDEQVFKILNQLTEENEQLKQKIKSINEILTKDMGYVESFEKIEEILK